MKNLSLLLVLTSLSLGALDSSSEGVSSIRLMDGDDSCSGRLEIRHDNKWGTVCQSSSQDPPVTAKDLKQLGCGTVLQVFTGVPSGKTRLTFMDYDTMCGGVPGRVRCEYKVKPAKQCKAFFSIKSSSISSPESSDVRLVGGNSPCDGILEVYFNHMWQKVVGDPVVYTVAEVACRQLGCGGMRSTEEVSSESHQFLPVSCTGEETHLSECLFYTERPSSSKSQLLRTVCGKPDLAFSTRLVGGESNCAGKVEVLVDDSWKMIHSGHQDSQLATVVCRELGCGSLVDVVRGSRLWDTSGAVWHYDIDCHGSEARLSQCVHRMRKGHNAEDPQDRLGVICSGTSVSQMRLERGSQSCEGKVEVYHNDTWGTLCNHGWDIHEAALVCRQTGCGPALEATTEDGTSDDIRPVWLDNIFCGGQEADLSLCGSQMLLQNQCHSGKRSGVQCSPKGISNVRLVNGDNECSGRLEVYYDDTWGTVCDEDWDFSDAAVVCKQLGCGSAIQTTLSNPFGPGSGPVWLKRVFCRGSESQLSQCASWMSKEFACSHAHDVGVTCSGADVGISNVRLVDGSSRCNGKLEFYSNKTWDRAQLDLYDRVHWDLLESSVLCKELKCGPVVDVNAKQDEQEKRRYAVVQLEGTNARIPEDQLPEVIHAEYSPWGVFCSGTESSISQCGAHRMSPQPYQHVYVECSDSDISGVRLVDGDNSCAGRVEVNYKNTWGTICDHQWDIEDATVVCRELKCGSAVEALRGAHFKTGSGPVWLNSVYCNGDETHISQCGALMTVNDPCDHSRAAGVICSGEKQVKKTKG